jgi:hypothetical protein
MKLTFCWITLLAIAQLCPLLGEDNDFERQTLVGITAVKVLVEQLPPGAAKLGLTAGSIQTDVELKLRLAGMRTMASSATYLYVNVNVIGSSRAANILVELRQNARLENYPTILAIGATTWRSGSLGENPNAQGIRNTIKDLVDQFLNDWLSVNPKR